MIIQVLTLTLTLVALQGVNGLKKIGGFQPTNMISDEIALDRDQSQMETFLQLNTDEGVADAKRIYEEGGYSGSYAYVTLTNNLSNLIPEGTDVAFTTRQGEVTSGTLRVDAMAGSDVVEIVYPVKESFSAPVSCREGALPNEKKLKSGCLNITKPIIIEGASYAVETVENKNYRTLKSLSDWLMTQDSPELDIYVKWYGSKNFSDLWVQASFARAPVPFANYAMYGPNYTFTGIRENVKKGTVYMGAMMTTLVYAYKASKLCGNKAKDGSKGQTDGLKFVDLGWGYYVGSLQGSSTKKGKNHKMYHALADKRCANFKTCAKKGDSFKGVSWVNIKILSFFVKMRNGLNKGKPKCTKMATWYKDIVSLVIMPCMQGVLRYALKKYKNSPPSEKEEAEGAVFFASILPFIAECDKAAADIIFDEMKIRWPDDLSKFNQPYSIVKEAFESVYKCSRLRYWCREVGGIYKDPIPGTLPIPEAEPCCSDYSKLANKKACDNKKKFGDPKKKRLFHDRCTTQRTKGKYYTYWCPKSCNDTNPESYIQDTKSGLDIHTCLWYADPDYKDKE